jgi:hypothetical protein
MRGAEHLEFEAVSREAMGEPFEPARPVLRMNRAAGPTLRTGTAGSQDESRCSAIQRRPPSR